DVGSPGGCSDAQIFGDCELRDALDNGNLPLPDPEPLPGDTESFPYFILGDDAFPLLTFLMKPYSRRGLDHPQSVFNYRLSRARRVVENAFGILANRWRCLLTTIPLEVSTVKKLVIAACTLHNMLRQRLPGTLTGADIEDSQHRLVPGAWRQGRDLEPLQLERGNKCNKAANLERDLLKASS
ncbi:MAG: transposase family protein, partial [Desulfobacterales bacterium]|nr:transposase family protein [Desulfobacterales bacterium]